MKTILALLIGGFLCVSAWGATFDPTQPYATTTNACGQTYKLQSSHFFDGNNVDTGTTLPTCTQPAVSFPGGITGLTASQVPAVLLTSGASRTLANGAEIVVCTTTCTVTPPASLTAGSQFCVQNDDNVSTVITLAAVTAVQYEGTARTSYGTANHTMTSGGAVKDQICMVAISTTKFNVFSSNGTWTNN